MTPNCQAGKNSRKALTPTTTTRLLWPIACRTNKPKSLFLKICSTERKTLIPNAISFLLKGLKFKWQEFTTCTEFPLWLLAWLYASFALLTQREAYPSALSPPWHLFRLLLCTTNTSACMEFTSKSTRYLVKWPNQQILSLKFVVWWLTSLKASDCTVIVIIINAQNNLNWIKVLCWPQPAEVVRWSRFLKPQDFRVPWRSTTSDNC